MTKHHSSFYMSVQLKDDFKAVILSENSYITFSLKLHTSCYIYVSSLSTVVRVLDSDASGGAEAGQVSKILK